MTTSLTSTQLEVQKELNDFIDYIDSFYGVQDPLYPLVKETDGSSLTKFDILSATE